MTTDTARHQENLLGICNAVGEDWGFNPLFLRLALAVTLLADPEIALGIYAILGMAVLVSRLLTRPYRPATAQTVPAQPIAVIAPCAPAPVLASEPVLELAA